MNKYQISDLASKNDGFSLVELLVVMALMGLIVGFVSSIYLFSERSLQRWRANIQLQNELYTLLNGISENIYESKAIIRLNRGNLELRMSPENNFIYTLKNKQLTRNGKPLVEENISVAALSFSSDKSVSSFSRLLQPQESEEDVNIVRIKMTLTDGRDTLRSARSVYLRKPPGWQPINSK